MTFFERRKHVEVILSTIMAILFIAVMIFVSLTLAITAVDIFLTTMEDIKRYKEEHKNVKNN